MYIYIYIYIHTHTHLFSHLFLETEFTEHLDKRNIFRVVTLLLLQRFFKAE